MKRIFLSAVTALALYGAALDVPVAVGSESIENSRNSQKRVDAAAEAAQNDFREFLETRRRIEIIKAYNERLRAVITAQNAEEISLNDQIVGIELTQQQIMPLMGEMLATLERFISRDLPFLKEERMGRIARLKRLADRADVTVSEKYRQIMEAYGIENEYSRTIEAYRGNLTEGDEKVLVDFLRIGRIGLYYRKIDGSGCGVYDETAAGWTVLDSDYDRPVKEAIRIARKEKAPDLLTLPVSAPAKAVQ